MLATSCEVLCINKPRSIPTNNIIASKNMCVYVCVCFARAGGVLYYALIMDTILS